MNAQLIDCHIIIANNPIPPNWNSNHIKLIDKKLTTKESDLRIDCF
jgi:hypothetical protein